MTSEGSFLSRFALKFLEVFAAGLATAVSGYLIAHFAGYLTTSTPTAVAQDPWTQWHAVSGSPGAVTAPPADPATTPSPAASIASKAPAAATPQSNTSDQPPASNAAAAKPRDATETRPREAARGPAAPSFEARVRAALAKAVPQPSAEAPRRQGAAPVDAAPRLSTAAPPPAETPTGSIAGAPPRDSAPRSTAVEPPPAVAAPMPQTPVIESTAVPTATIQLTPPATVEIKSQPVVNVDANQPAQAATAPPTTDKGGDGPFAALTRRLRIDKQLPGDQAPRPPMPVGE